MKYISVSEMQYKILRWIEYEDMFDRANSHFSRLCHPKYINISVDRRELLYKKNIAEICENYFSSPTYSFLTLDFLASCQKSETDLSFRLFAQPIYLNKKAFITCIGKIFKYYQLAFFDSKLIRYIGKGAGHKSMTEWDENFIIDQMNFLYGSEQMRINQFKLSHSIWNYNLYEKRLKDTRTTFKVSKVVIIDNGIFRQEIKYSDDQNGLVFILEHWKYDLSSGEEIYLVQALYPDDATPCEKSQNLIFRTNCLKYFPKRSTINISVCSRMKTESTIEKTFITQAFMIKSIAHHFDIDVTIQVICVSNIVNPSTIDAVQMYKNLSEQFGRISHKKSFLWRTPIGRNIANFIFYLSQDDVIRDIKELCVGHKLCLDWDSPVHISVNLLKPILIDKNFQIEI